MYRNLVACSLAVLLAVPACAGGNPPERPARPANGIAPPARIPEVVTEHPRPPGEPVSVATLSREARRAVVADAARRFKVSENAVVLTRAEQVTWPDASLGCPEPGRLYAQVLVAGYRLVAKTSAGELIYHADQRGNVATCTGEKRH